MGEEIEQASITAEKVVEQVSTIGEETRQIEVVIGHASTIEVLLVIEERIDVVPDHNVG